GPWTIVEATDRRHTILKIYRTILTSIEERLRLKGLTVPEIPTLEKNEAEAVPDAEPQIVSESPAMNPDETITPDSQTVEQAEEIVVNIPETPIEP
ncbi:MAG: hypothetical protein ACM3PY_11455, partial [Omnitrophica WOR_2 bacterium]